MLDGDPIQAADARYDNDRLGVEPTSTGLDPKDSAAQWDEWLRLFANRNEVAYWYAAALRGEGADWDGWPNVNDAIVRRWSLSALAYIKEKAWKIATLSL